MKALVLKTSEPKGSVGSNPTSSANSFNGLVPFNSARKPCYKCATSWQGGGDAIRSWRATCSSFAGRSRKCPPRAPAIARTGHVSAGLVALGASPGTAIKPEQASQNGRYDIHHDRRPDDLWAVVKALERGAFLHGRTLHSRAAGISVDPSNTAQASRLALYGRKRRPPSDSRSG